MSFAGFDLNLLRVFEALMETGSVTAAGRRLGLGQSATSAALARLRQAFGDELFLRTPAGMRPSPRAEELAPGIARILAEARLALESGAIFDPARSTRRFTLASTDYTTATLLPPLLDMLRREAPGVDLRVIGYDKGDIPTMVERGEIDAALGVFPAPPGGAVVTPLHTEHFLGVARQGHPALRRGTMDLDRFCAWPHALVTTRRDATGALDEALAAQGRARRVAVTLPHMLCLPALLATTDLLAAMPARLAARMPGLRRFPLPLPVAPWQVVMLWPATARQDRGAAWLRGAIRTAADAL
jgi:DNA-binding transcriptional LysR family regulator